MQRTRSRIALPTSEGAREWSLAISLIISVAMPRLMTLLSTPVAAVAIVSWPMAAGPRARGTNSVQSSVSAQVTTWPPASAAMFRASRPDGATGWATGTATPDPAERTAQTCCPYPTGSGARRPMATSRVRAGPCPGRLAAAPSRRPRRPEWRRSRQVPGAAARAPPEQVRDLVVRQPALAAGHQPDPRQVQAPALGAGHRDRPLRGHQEHRAAGLPALQPAAQPGPAAAGRRRRQQADEGSRAAQQAG